MNARPSTVEIYTLPASGLIYQYQPGAALYDEAGSIAVLSRICESATAG